MLRQGRKAVSQPYTIDGKKYYRVQVRAGKEITTAQNLEKTLEQQFPGAFVIAR